MPRSHDGNTVSVWMATSEVPEYPRLKHDVTADVCIIGAGISGLMTAYSLIKEGRSVVVLDSGTIGGGQSGRTTAHFSSALDDRYYDLERLFGREGARLAAESHTAAIDRVEQIVTSEHIACDFERLDGYLFVPPGERTDVLRKEHDAARRAGLDVDLIDRAPIDYDTGLCLRFRRQAQLHPMKLLVGLANAITRAGGRIYTSTHVESIESLDAARAKVITSGGRAVSSAHAVVATNTPINDRVAIHTKQAAYRTYVVGLRVPVGTVTRALYWDTPDPYHYVRVTTVERDDERYDVLVVGGEDHKTGQEDRPAERWAKLEAWTRERFPQVREIVFRWSGQVMEPMDSLAYIGKNPGDENVYIVTGDSGNGMTHGTIAGTLLTDVIQGRSNRWAQLYEPSRRTLRAGAEFLRENLNVAAQYTDWVRGGDVKSADEIEPGQGAIVRKGLAMIAAYRDDTGDLHQMSAACTHMGCVVQWNRAEKTWDCPCHGSRFAATGMVVEGPAVTALPAFEGDGVVTEEMPDEDTQPMEAEEPRPGV